MATQNDLNTPVVAVVGFLGAIIVVVIILLVMVVFQRAQSRQQYAKDISEPYAQVSRLVADQQGRLASYGWVDQKKGIAFIPVSRAMHLVVAELSANPHAVVTGVEQPAAPPAEGKAPPDGKRASDGRNAPHGPKPTDERPVDGERPTEEKQAADDAKPPISKKEVEHAQ